MRAALRIAPLLLLLQAGGVARGAPVARAAKAVAPGGGGPRSAVATSGVSEARLGQPFTVTVEVKHAPGEHWSLAPTQKLDPFVLIGQTREDVPAGKLVTTRFGLKLALFKLGPQAIPDIALAGGPGQALSLPGPTVKGIAPDIVKDRKRRDIRGPVAVTVRSYRLLWIGLAGLAALSLLVAAAGWWRRRPRRGEAAPAPPPVPADEAALAALAALEGEGLPAKGRFKEFHLRLSLALRAYLSARYGILALDMTSTELQAELARLPTEGLRLADVAWLCAQGDLAKFAKAEPTPDDCKEALSRCRQIVIRTRVAAAPEAAA